MSNLEAAPCDFNSEHRNSFRIVIIDDFCHDAADLTPPCGCAYTVEGRLH